MKKNKKEKLQQENYASLMDQALQAVVARLTGGLSPAALLLALTDWLSHLTIHPSKQYQLINLYFQNAWHLYAQLVGHLLNESYGEYAPISSLEDKRFIGKYWQQFPYSFIYESFLISQDWWHEAVCNVRGVSKHHQDVLDFAFRQILDMLSPSNYFMTNPEIQVATLRDNGENLIRGISNFVEDGKRYLLKLPPVGAEKYVVGENLAVTPGKVIYRNHLMELIQYQPKTEKVFAEPVLITPAWIMKYYILDLVPKHSLVNYLIKKGHTVFMISWKNPNKSDRHLGMEDYLNLGILAALDVVNDIIRHEKIHLITV